jgi:hypothetical protein
LALDFQGRFLFVATSANNIEMYSIDSTTGALQEVPNSPFASTHTSSPMFLSTESTGQFLYVINFNGSKPEVSSVESFQIDAVNLDLIPTAAGATDLPGLFVGGATHPSGKSFYVFVNDPSSNPPNQPHFLLFNSSNGTFTQPGVLPVFATEAAYLALDPQGRFLALATQDQLTSQDLLADGTLGSNNLSVSIITTPPSGGMTFDSLGQFLYLSFTNPPSPSVHFYLPSTLQEFANSPLPSNFQSTTSWIIDPTGPLIYADQVYKVDPQTGVPSSILPSSPISPPAVFSVPPGSQPIQGPVALLNPTSLTFGTLTVGQISSALTLTISSIGGQALSLNTTTITGTNASDFSITGDSCHAPTVLQPGTTCSVLISFTPSAAGARSASLTISDNAAPPTQSVSLSGTGLAPAPAVTLVPGSLNFGTVTQGTSASLNISVTNSGNAVLHISSLAVGGANAKDYSSSSPTCTSPIAVNSSCSIVVTFTPAAPGLRSANLTIADDAPDSPQTVALSGTGGTAAPAITFSPATPAFPSTTQGTSSAPQILTVGNSGNAPLHISSVALSGSNASEFSFTNNCTAAVAPASNCSLSLVFSPLASGQRTANLMISDDAAGSPQSIALSAAAGAAFSAGAAPGGSTSATVSAGQTAQFQLQLTPGPGYSGTLSLACSGAPLNATCQVPSSIALATGTPAPFTVTVTTSGLAALPPSPGPRFLPFTNIPVLLLSAFVAFLLILLVWSRGVVSSSCRVRWAFPRAFGALLFAIALSNMGGCGGGNASVAPPPPPVITPSGNFTITVTPSATSSTGQPLQVSAIQLTLTVK